MLIPMSEAKRGFPCFCIKGCESNIWLKNRPFLALNRVQTITGGPDPADNVRETLPIVPEGRVNKVFHGLPVGSYLSVRVRAIGSRGPSPWTEIATLRVN